MTGAAPEDGEAGRRPTVGDLRKWLYQVVEEWPDRVLLGPNEHGRKVTGLGLLFHLTRTVGWFDHTLRTLTGRPASSEDIARAVGLSVRQTQAWLRWLDAQGVTEVISVYGAQRVLVRRFCAPPGGCGKPVDQPVDNPVESVVTRQSLPDEAESRPAATAIPAGSYCHPGRQLLPPRPAATAGRPSTEPGGEPLARTHAEPEREPEKDGGAPPLAALTPPCPDLAVETAKTESPSSYDEELLRAYDDGRWALLAGQGPRVRTLLDRHRPGHTWSDGQTDRASDAAAQSVEASDVRAVLDAGQPDTAPMTGRLSVEELRPELREQIEAMIREGQGHRVAQRYRHLVPEITAAMGRPLASSG